jgi:DNA-binding response OmpR family regulator
MLTARVDDVDRIVGLERTVDSHIKNLRKKTERGPAALAPPVIETDYGVGYRLRPLSTASGSSWPLASPW